MYAFDSKAQHCSYNINYLYPSGGSLPHPHSQVFLDPYPTTLMRIQQQEAERYHSQHQGCYWHELVEAEKRTAARFITELGNTAWFTAFAPLGFNEVRAVVRDLTRTAMVPYYRSDSMYMERMHWEAAVDRMPESLAGDLRKWFATARTL